MKILWTKDQENRFKKQSVDEFFENIIDTKTLKIKDPTCFRLYETNDGTRYEVIIKLKVVKY